MNRKQYLINTHKNGLIFKHHSFDWINVRWKSCRANVSCMYKIRFIKFCCSYKSDVIIIRILQLQIKINFTVTINLDICKIIRLCHSILYTNNFNDITVDYYCYFIIYILLLKYPLHSVKIISYRWYYVFIDSIS